MTAGAYYNEHEPFAAAWLRNLIAEDLIAPGEVDERSIVDVRPDDVRGFTQCHFFAGIGIWSLALRRAGWHDSRPGWTGSCPCQGFSVAGSGKGFNDERHLWPEFFRLIRECLPPVVFGEQVASPLALSWLDLVHDDLEGAGYAVGAADLCAAGVGAPHIRQRLYWVANLLQDRCGTGRGTSGSAKERDGGTASGCGQAHGLSNAEAGGLGIDGSSPRERGHASQCDPACGMDDACESRGGRDARTVSGQTAEGQGQRRETRSLAYQLVDAGSDSGMGDSDRTGQQRSGQAQPAGRERYLVSVGTSPLGGFWRNAEWLGCRDGRARPVEPGTFPLANGAISRVGRVRAYGNALCEAVAQEFIEVVMECLPC